MSGIVGILSFAHASQNPMLIKHLMSAIAHRGKDHVGHWTSGRTALGCCLLRATQQSEAEIQPLLDTKNELAVVMDGRLDNREELFARIRPGLDFATTSDATLLLAAYRHWGEACPEYLLGDFAFAIWDAKKEKLFCARDPMGGAGFSYHHGKDFFAFATESEALLRLPGISKEPNTHLIACFLVPAFQNRGDRRSWQSDVTGLMPGESLTLDKNANLRIRKYWTFKPRPNRKYASYQEAEEHFLTVFGRAVKDRMNTQGDVALMMSGGLDSAGIAAMSHRLMRDAGRKTLNAYSAVDDDPGSCIESRSIESLSKSCETNLRTVSVPSFHGMVNVDDLLDVTWGKPHPVTNSIILPALMCLAARRNGHTAILHGAGGDTTMQPPPHYQSGLIRKGQLLNAWRECKAAGNNLIYLRNQSPASIFVRSALFAFAPPLLLKKRSENIYRKRVSPIENSLINPEFAARLHLQERLDDEFYQGLDSQYRNWRAVRIDRATASICSGLSGYNSVAGRFAIEARDPWSDQRVLDFFFRLPPEYLVRGGRTKSLVRTSFSTDLAPLVRLRKDKTHLGWRLTERVMGESRALLADTMESELYEVDEFVDLDQLRNVYRNYCKYGGHDNRQAVFDLLTIVLWLRRIFAL